ncbi:MAG: malto-oligosyltrehalose trehalohydrolase [Deltaproteobacteria bacterium]|nr:malto-oligosyltrehalose trehalohydrolase [Deltaproteobacteria bacterium]
MDPEKWSLKLGAAPEDGGVRFRIWAPRFSNLQLKIQGKAGTVPLTAEGNGYFTARVAGLGAGTQYFYRLPGNRLRPDPVSRFQPEGVHGPSEVVDPDDFRWEDHFWKGITLEKMIFYEIHTGTFTAEGTFEAVIPLLDYLKDELGVTAVELMPVAQFPGERNWGYDGTFLYAPQNSYGGPRGLKKLIDACHRKGLAVILDVVYNHLGPEGNYLNEYGPYFTDRYQTPWGAAVNLDGPESDEVRRFMIANALYWVTEYHLDGLRIDAVHGIIDFSARHILAELKQAVQQQAGKLGRPVAVIAESDLNDVRVINSSAKGGYGLDAQWNDDFHHALHALLTRERGGYYQDFGNLDQLARALRDGFVYSGQYSAFRRRRHGSPSGHLPPAKFVVFSQNHDQVGNRAQGERLSTLISLEALKLAAALVLLSPHLPLLFMGEEYGEEAPFLYFVSHSDPGLIEAVRQGRRKELSPFPEKGAPPDPQDERTYFLSKVHPDLRRQGNHKVLFEYYKGVISLRKKIPALAHLLKKGLEIKASAERLLLTMVRRYPGDQAVCCFNFSGKSQEIQVPLDPGVWQKALDSSATEWGGPGESAPEALRSGDAEVRFEMQPWSAVLYRKSNSGPAGE